MSAQHTPGPWHVDAEAHQGPYIVGGSRAVAQMVHTHRKPLDYEEQANARLIAAAPDLLVALEAIIAVYAMNNAEPVELRDALKHQIAGASAARSRALGLTHGEEQ